MRSSGQAFIELAIVGSLALLALAVLIRIGLGMNYKQEIEQQAFRLALRAAKNEGDEESPVVSYQFFRDRRVPDPSQGFAIMPGSLTQGSGSATWGEYLTFLDDSRDSQARILVKLNNASEKEFRSEDLDEDQPFVSDINKHIQSTGVIAQSNARSSLATTTDETTTLVFHLKDGGADAVSSTESSHVNLNW